jgi:hypothetical protein
LREAAAKHGLNYTSLFRYKKDNFVKEATPLSMGYSHNKIITESQERTPAKYFTRCADIYCKRPLKEVRKLAFGLIKKYNVRKLSLGGQKSYTLKKAAIAPKRKLQNSNPARQDFKVEIAAAESESWKKFCSTQNRETVWSTLNPTLLLKYYSHSKSVRICRILYPICQQFVTPSAPKERTFK